MPATKALTKLVTAARRDRKTIRCEPHGDALAWLLKHPSRHHPHRRLQQPRPIRDAAAADAVDVSREDWYRLLVAARMQPLP